MSVWDFGCPECGQRGRWGTASFPKRGIVPSDVKGAGQVICECSECHTLLRIGTPWYFLGARPHAIPRSVLEEAARRDSADQPGAARARLLEALARLSASASEQEAYLEAIDSEGSATELVSELHDVMDLAPPKATLGKRGFDSLSAIDRHVGSMNDRPEVWKAAALADAPEWEEMRRLARIAADDVRRGW